MNFIEVRYPYAGSEAKLWLESHDFPSFMQPIRHQAAIEAVSHIAGSTFVLLRPLLRGGKGGFGKLLKSQKHLGKNTDNFDSCRGEDGRKLKHIKREEKIAELQSKKESNGKKESESAPPKSAVMLDEKYTKRISAIRHEKQSVVSEGLRVVTEPVKEPDEPAPKKMKKIGLFDDDDSE
jgi:hypothetical protein